MNLDTILESLTIEYYKILIIQTIRRSIRLLNLTLPQYVSNERSLTVLRIHADMFIQTVQIAFEKGLINITEHELNQSTEYSVSVYETPCTEVDIVSIVVQDILTDTSATFDVYDERCVIRYKKVNGMKMQLTFEKADEKFVMLLLMSKFENKI